MEDFNFTELRRRISKYFENDAQSHPNGPEALQRERVIREKIKAHVSRPSVSPGLVDQIKNITNR